MTSYRYKEYSDDKFEIVVNNEVVVATVERGDDNSWHVLPDPNWVPHAGFNFGPFRSSEDAFEELGAVQADQS